MQLNHEFDKFDWCNFADIWPPLYQQLLSWQFVIPFRFLKYFILILTFLKKCSVLEKNFTFLKIHIGNYRKRGSSCSTAGLLYNEGLLLVTGLQQTGGNGFCHERSHCMKSTERNLYSRSPKCLLFESGQILSAWLQFFLILKQFGFGMFFCALKKLFFLKIKIIMFTILYWHQIGFFVISIWIDEYLFVGIIRNVIVFVL